MGLKLILDFVPNHSISGEIRLWFRGHRNGTLSDIFLLTPGPITSFLISYFRG
jgi:hypothetical protein